MKFRHKLLAMLAGMAALSGLLVGAGTLFLLRSAVESRLVERFRSETALLAALVASGRGERAPEALAAEWGQRLGVRVTLIGRDGRVLGDSSVADRRLETLENHLDRPEVREALRSGWGEARRRSTSTGETFLYVARRLDGGAGPGFVRVALPAWEVRRAEAPYLWMIVALSAAAPALLLGLAYFAVRRWSRPLEDLAVTAGRIAGGDLELEVRPKSDDEVGALAVALERTRHAIGMKIAELEGERQFLGSVIGSMNEGLLLVDEQRRVRLVNEAFRRTWGARSDPQGRPLTEVVRHPQVLAAVDAVLGTQRDTRQRVVHPANGRTFELHASRLAPPGRDDLRGAVIMLFDVTRLEALETMRKEFVADVSHELRTPITSIKAAVLTLLEDGGPERGTRERFLGTIRRNAERMTVLVEDLTDLSLIETGAIKLDRRPLDPAALARDVVAQIAPRYTALQLRVDLDFPADFTVVADRRRLEQVLVNLVDNAMKFNRPGGTVTIRGRADGSHATLVVADTGEGIPSEDLDKIFRRFFRVDPARSRELGGTGLGLAIVKHLVQLHGGTIRAESELGHGSQFTIELPG